VRVLLTVVGLVVKVKHLGAVVMLGTPAGSATSRIPIAGSDYHHYRDLSSILRLPLCRRIALYPDAAHRELQPLSDD